MVRVARAGWTPERLTDALADHGVLTLPMGATSGRCVTHLDVGPVDVERLERALEAVLA
jgi:hypothetical protein